MTSKPISIYCPYCHRYTSIAPAPGFSDSVYKTQTILALWNKSENEQWWIGICNSCHKAVLVFDSYNSRKIYPHSLPSPTDERIPEHIRKDIDEAKLCFSVNAYRACAVMARRAIQNACIDKGANKKKSLKGQIEELTSKGMITNDLKKWTDVIRWVGNDAAHPEKNEVAMEDAEDILKLAEQFMHVIYVTPAIAKERRKKRGK